MTEKMISAREAADWLGVSPLTIRRLAAAGALRARRYSERGHLRIPAEDVERLIRNSEFGGDPEGSGVAPDHGGRDRDSALAEQSGAVAARYHEHGEALA